jgi:crossover junction endodeoxyribonuclease RuvC
MAMQILGIDPGITGGVAVISAEGIRPPMIEDGMRMPLTSHRGKRIVDGVKLNDWLERFDIEAAVVEQVNGRPGQAGVFQFGRATGAAEAIAMLHAERMSWVTPPVWKQHFGLSKDKQQSIDEARHRFGNSYCWDKKADNGIAEAALLAQWYLDKRV